MSQQNPIRIFVTHLWEESDDYLRVFEYLESARNFFYRNLSRPDARPSGGKEAQKEQLREQIRACEVVIALSSLHPHDADLLAFQVLFAKASDKPVLLLPGFGSGQAPPKALADLSDAIVGWDERGIIDAIRREARHEDTTRWDVVEFKLD
ncbi:MAG: hypothetical protein IPI06_05375 [Gammaproteobacteria bacterium]|nr:hypothetical protein [Gammaproteobacteria bacterium]